MRKLERAGLTAQLDVGFADELPYAPASFDSEHDPGGDREDGDPNRLEQAALRPGSGEAERRGLPSSR